jgi:hypothetical protein
MAHMLFCYHKLHDFLSSQTAYHGQPPILPPNRQGWVHNNACEARSYSTKGRTSHHTQATSATGL